MEKDKYLSILQRYWGYDDFRGIQREIIESISQGKDTLGLMPTGGGKSITFQVPALAMEGVCVVITPLIALMKDQVIKLKERGIRAVAIHAAMNHNEIIAVLERRVGLNLSKQDVYVNVVGGMEINEPAADLGIALAIATRCC